MAERFRLVSDEDGHDYVIPADKLDEWDAFMSDEEAKEDGIVPEWAREIGGSVAHALTFTDPKLWKENEPARVPGEDKGGGR